MIVVNPESSVLAFEKAAWVMEQAPLPKQEIKTFLSDKHDELHALMSRELKEDEELDSVKEGDLREMLLDIDFDNFSLAPDGSILLTSGDYQDSSVMFTGADADVLRATLRDAIKERVDRLQEFLRK